MNFDHSVIAFNDAADSDNRMHSDDMAQRFGFRGALVPGVTVYGYLTQPLVRTWGESWLAGGTGAVRLIKPAYHGERLTIQGAETGDGVLVEAFDPEGVLIATLHATLGPQAAEGPWQRAPAAAKRERVEIAWDVIDVDQPLPVRNLTWSLDGNVEAADLLTDDLPLWRADECAPVHPVQIARLTNLAFSGVWHMPAWMHVGTEFRHLRTIRCGDRVEMRSIPVEKWERKGHEFARLYIAMLVDGELAVEAQHTAIFKVAAR